MVEVKVLVTGATGRVGANLVRSLVEQGYEVRCSVLEDDPKASKLEKFDVEVLRGSLLEKGHLKEAVLGVDAVYHLGGLLPGGNEPDAIFDVNVVGTYNLFEALRIHNPEIERFIFASSDDPYDVENAKYQPIDENHPQLPYSTYSFSKVAGEYMCKMYQSQNNFPCVRLRFGYVIGAGEILYSDYFPFNMVSRMLSLLKGMPESPEAAKAIETLEPLYEGVEKVLVPVNLEGEPMKMHPVDVRDLVQILLLALTKDEAVGDVFNAAGPAPFTLREAGRYAAEKTGLPLVEAELPVFVWRYEHSIAKARSILGYRPEYDVFRMIDDAVRFNDGEDIGVVPS